MAKFGKSDGSDNLQALITRLYRLQWNMPDITWKDVLRILYIEKEMSLRDVAVELSISLGTVQKYIQQEGLCKIKWRK